ncbi:MAG: hypothetical protein AAF636_15285 [Pseudomonadota bacterium]
MNKTTLLLISFLFYLPIVADASEMKIRCQFDPGRSGFIPEEAVYSIDFKSKQVVALDAIIQFANQKPVTTDYYYAKRRNYYGFRWKLKLPVEITQRWIGTSSSRTWSSTRTIRYEATFHPDSMTVRLNAHAPGGSRRTAKGSRCKQEK